MKDIAFTEKGGYVVLYAKNGSAFKSISQPMADALKKLNKNDNEINLISTYKDKWVIIYDKNGYICNF